MRKTLFCAASLVLATVVSAQDHPFSDVEHWVPVFEDAERKIWQKPLLVLDALGVMDGEVVADVGAGSGYFTGLLSILVGDAGKVYAVDIEQAMLDHIATRADVAANRVEYVLARPDDPKLPAGEVDLILIVDTWHHISKRPKYLKKLQQALSPEGRVVVIDYREGDLPVGPPADHKLAREVVVAEFEKAKWTLVSESMLLPYQYFLIFYPPE